MSSPREDPVLAYNFQLSLYDSTTSPSAPVTTIALSPLVSDASAGFAECTGLEMTLDVDEWEEGGNNGTVLKFPKRAKWGDITLRRGLTRKTDLFDWYYGFSQGFAQRKDGLITLLDEAHQPHTVWGFRRGLPVKYTAPQLNASQNAAAIESVTIAHEGIYLLAGAAGLAAAVGEVAGAIGDLF